MLSSRSAASDSLIDGGPRRWGADRSMNDADERLVGDPIWELFPGPSPVPRQDTGFTRRYRYVLAAVGVAALAWVVSPAVSVVTACLAIAAPDFQMGRRLGQSIPDKAGGRICALFTWAWGAWKLALTAFALMFLITTIHFNAGKRSDVPMAFIAAMVLWLAGATVSSVLTAAGLVKAYRSGMRVWVGEGINRARTLLMGMLVAAFAYFVLVPTCLWLATVFPKQGEPRRDTLTPLLGFFGLLFAGPIAIVVVLDWFSHHIVADEPSKFGPKVSAVGKWDTTPTDSLEP